MHATLLFDSQGRPTPALKQLLLLTGLDYEPTLDGLLKATQENWYQARKLRVEIQDLGTDPTLVQRAREPLAKLGLVNEVRPEISLPYKGALLLGATLPAVRKRLRSLIGWHRAGVRFGHMILLGSERPLRPENESLDVLYNAQNSELPYPADRQFWTPDNRENQVEIDMMTTVSSQAVLPWHSPVICVRAEGTVGTRQTLETWRDQFNPEPGEYLVVSSQPFVSFQALVAQKVMGPEFVMHGCGYGRNDTPLAQHLDNVAKLIYELAN